MIWKSRNWDETRNEDMEYNEIYLFLDQLLVQRVKKKKWIKKHMKDVKKDGWMIRLFCATDSREWD